MSVAQLNQSTFANEILYVNTSVNNSVSSIKGSSGRIFFAQIDNSNNVNSVWLKLYDLVAASVVVSVTDPNEIILVPGNSVVTAVFSSFAGTPGKLYANAISAICVTTPGTTGNAAPLNNVGLQIKYS